MSVFRRRGLSRRSHDEGGSPPVTSGAVERFMRILALIECKNAVVRNLCVHSQAGHGLQAHRCENLVLEQIKIVPQCGLRVSTNCDAMHLLSCRGNIVIDGCQTIGQGDDGVNVQGYYYRVFSHADKTCLVRLDTRNGLAHSFEADHPDKGDHVRLVRRRDLAEFEEYRVESVEPADDNSWIVTLERPFPELDASEDWLIYSVEQSCPSLTIRNCTFASHLARGILVKARNVLVENNVFYNTALTAMQFLPEVFYAECHTSEHVVIRSNLIYDAGFLTQWAKEYLGAAAILFDMQSKDSSPSVHRDILIENNLIHCPEGDHGIVLKHVKDCIVRFNQICTRGESVVADAATCSNVTINGQTCDR